MAWKDIDWKDVVTLLVPGTGIFPALAFSDENPSLVEKIAMIRDGLLVIALGALTYR